MAIEDSMPDDKEHRWSYIGRRIREARDNAGLTRRQVAERLGINEQSVWLWEVGRSKPTTDHLVELVSYLDVTADWLLGRDIVEAEILKETDISFRADLKGLPLEDVESVREFIQFVRQRRRNRRRDD